MIKLYDGGVYLVHGTEIVPEKEIAKVKQLTGKDVSKEDAKKNLQRFFFASFFTLLLVLFSCNMSKSNT